MRLTAGSTPPSPGDFFLYAPESDILRARDIYIQRHYAEALTPDLYLRESLSESMTKQLESSIAISNN